MAELPALGSNDLRTLILYKHQKVCWRVSHLGL